MIPKLNPTREPRRVHARLRTICDKDLRRLIREERRLHRAMWDAPVVPLEEPYQRGWYRFLILSERAHRRPDLEHLKELLAIVDQKQLCRKGKFLQYCPRRKRIVEMNHRPRRFSLWEMRRLKLPDYLFKYFRQSVGYRNINREMLRELPFRGWTGKFEVNCEHLFDSVTAPYIVTHQKIDMPEVRARLAEIDEWLEQNQGWDRYHNLKGIRGWRSYESRIDDAKRKRLDEKEMREAKFAFNDGRPLDGDDIEFEKSTTNVVLFCYKTQSLYQNGNERKNHRKVA